MKVDTVSKAGFSAPPRLIALTRFLIVGFSGIAVNELVYVGLVDKLAIWFVIAAVVSTEVSTTWNFLGNEMWAFSGRRFAGSAWIRYVAYAAMNNAFLLLRVPMLWLLTDFAHMSPAWSNLIALGALFAMRFAVSDGWVWRKKGESEFPIELDESGEAAAAYRYDIGGLIQLHSDAELPELAYFRTPTVAPADIRIRVRRVGLAPKTRVRLRRDGERITYREHLGVLGADFNVTLGDPIEIEASPLLALSRHVLYTNVVEALLRFVLVSKGYVLLHSAGMEVDGLATLLSAQTDTGKTSTVINLIRERHWHFISDDMAIIDPAGKVLTFPKPMTLSYHTMTRAVDASTLSPKRRMQLQVQSRVHSKSGRSVGKGLGSMNVPIMSINSVLQIMVPPPKYHITALLPTHIAAETPIANVFLMERGEPIQERVPLESAIDQLIENTDDAYGFPPFSTLAPTLVIGGRNYQELRARERELLTAALSNVNIWRLRVRGHEWNELLPRLIAEGNGTTPVAVPIETKDREPVGVPIEPDPWAEQLPAETPELVAISYEGDALPVRSRRPQPADAGADYTRSRTTAAAEAYRPEAYDPRPFPGSRRQTRSARSGRNARDAARDSGPPPGFRVGGIAPSEALAMNPYGRFGLTGELPVMPDITAARTRAAARIRVGARMWLALGTILFVGAVVRLWGIGSVGFNNDEAVYAGQGAALAGDPTFSGLFAIFRAHPLLVQFLYSIPFRLFGVDDIWPRLISVGFGVSAIALAYATGNRLYGRRVGLIAAAVLAVMPYHVVVTRQALLDGPETTLFLLSMFLLATYARTGSSRWLYGAAFTTGLTVLAKETAVLIVPVAVAFLLLVPEVRIPLRRQITALVLFLIAVGPYPAAILIGKATGTAGSFVLWEILRQPNHTWTFYGEILPGAVGPLVFIAAVAGLLYALRRGRWEDRLLFCWVLVPVAFFEVWPVKGYQYLLPISPAIAILAGLAFDRLIIRAEALVQRRALAPAAAALPIAAQPAMAVPAGMATAETTTVAQPATAASPVAPVVSRTLAGRSGTRLTSQPAIVLSAILLAVTLASIAIPSALAVNTTSMTGSLAGTGGLPGGREAGTWIRTNVPENGTFLTLGPTLANIVEFYGQRRAYGLSVSPNPLRRNPAYDPINNPDRALQLNQIQYIATDIWSAQRSPFFDSLLRRYVSRYHGVLVYQQSAQVRDSSGNVSTQVVIQIYEVRP
jgi:4-amino-4-deoxy-L-arabinose transferase-like glycosyltransferase/putative flippase GtrA